VHGGVSVSAVGIEQRMRKQIIHSMPYQRLHDGMVEGGNVERKDKGLGKGG
jgi:hypothetical protein